MEISNFCNFKGFLRETNEKFKLERVDGMCIMRKMKYFFMDYEFYSYEVVIFI